MRMTTVEQTLIEKVDAQEKEIEELREMVAQQAQKIEELLAIIQELRGGKKDSHNSSKPPSSDGYNKKPVPKSLRKASGKKQGGQMGHKGSGMKISQKPDQIVAHYPASCEGCPHKGNCETRVCEGRYEIDLIVKRNVTLHQQMECRCVMRSNQVIKGTFPEGITATKQYGKNITAFVTALHTVGMVSIDRVRQFMEGVIGIQMSTGTIKTKLEGLRKSVRTSVKWIKGKVKQLPLIHCDETGLRVEGSLHWLHCCCDQNWTYLFIHKNRGKKAMEEMGILPDYTGILETDCWCAYFQYTDVEHALCNAHLARELVYAAENLGQLWAEELKSLLFEIHQEREMRKCAGETAFSPTELADYYARYDAIVQTGLSHNPVPEKASGKRGRTAKGKIRALLERLERHKDDFLHFVRNWTVPFSNNEAERSIRFSKVKQKVSGCFRTEEGAQECAEIMSYILTARKHGVSFFDAIHSALNGDALNLVQQWR